MSPGNKLALVLFSRNCGATTGENYQASMVAPGEQPTGKGNVLVLDHAPSYSDTYRPAWTSDKAVVVPVPRGARVFVKNEDVNGVRVTFKQT